MIDFVLLGSGWRSLFYARLSVRFPHEFRLTGWMVHDPAKRIAYAQEYHTFTSHALDEVLERPHDLVVLCVPDTLQHDLLVTLAERGEPVLTETSFLRQNEASLKDILVRCQGKTVEVAEQYPLLPYYQQVSDLQPRLGKIWECTVASCHFHHAAALTRHFLEEEEAACTISAQTAIRRIAQTGSRYGYHADGTTKEITRTVAVLRFPDGKTGWYAFTGEEYHSTILSGHFALRGERGEIFDRTARYLDDANQTIIRSLEENKDDEEGIAECLRRFGHGYSLRNGIIDALVGQAIQEAAKTGKPISFLPPNR
ncbi:MAG: hypothetical protein LKE28_09480 [Sphaerochaeta sp.]|nr:hypothetical protein [Sphaerochaeta sp.]